GVELAPRLHRAALLRAVADEAPARPALGRGPPPRGARVVHRRERAAEPVCGARGGAAVRDPLEDHLVVVDLDDLHDPRPTSRRGEPPQSGGLVAEEVGAEALGVAGRSALDPVAASAAHAATLPRAFRPSNGPASTTISAPPTTIGATVQRIPRLSTASPPPGTRPGTESAPSMAPGITVAIPQPAATNPASRTANSAGPSSTNGATRAAPAPATTNSPPARPTRTCPKRSTSASPATRPSSCAPWTATKPEPASPAPRSATSRR